MLFDIIELKICSTILAWT